MSDKRVGGIVIDPKKNTQKTKKTFNKKEWVKSNKGTFYRHKIGSCVPVLSTQVHKTGRESQNILLAL